MAVLAVTAGLPGIFSLHIGKAAHRFFIGDLRLTDVGFHVKLAEQTIDNNLEV